MWDLIQIDEVDVWKSNDTSEPNLVSFDSWLYKNDDYGCSLDGIKESMRADGASEDDISNTLVELYQEFQEWLEKYNLFEMES